MKRQEWVHIYISGCDTKGVAQISPALTLALGALSQHIKVVPMGDGEDGTCIVETPEEMFLLGGGAGIHNNALRLLPGLFQDKLGLELDPWPGTRC